MEGKGAGRSRYSGLRVELLIQPQTGRGYVRVSRKHWRDGWDHWLQLVPLRRFENLTIENDEDAVSALRRALDALTASDE